MKRSILLLALFLLVSHTWAVCQPDRIMFQKLTDKKGLVYAPGQKKPYTGTVFANYKNRGRRLRGEYKEGLPHGIWTYWNEEGRKERTESYKKGKKEGNWTYFDEDGIMDRIESYLNGEPSGKVTTFYGNGKREKVEFYLKGNHFS